MKKEYAEYLLNKTREDFDLIAGDFSRTRWNIWAEFSVFRNYIKDGDRVLDLGCGNGRLLELLKDKKIDYIGVDGSGNLIKIAQEKYPRNKFLLADAFSLPFPDNSFDKVFAIAILHHIPSKEYRLCFLKEVKRVLQSDGLLILTVWDIWRREALLAIIKYFFLKLTGKSQFDFGDVFVKWGRKTKRYYHYFTKKELFNLIRKLNFKIIKSGMAKNETGRRSNLYLIAKNNKGG